MACPILVPYLIRQIETHKQIIMKVIQSGCQIERRLIIFRRTRVRQPFYFGSTRTPGHLILGVLAKFSGVYYSCTHVNGSPGHIGGQIENHLWTCDWHY